MAAKRSIVTVEKIVGDLALTSPNAIVPPGWTISAIVDVPGGAHPSYTYGYYGRDNGFNAAWDEISLDREGFLRWVTENVLNGGPEDFAAHKARRAI